MKTTLVDVLLSLASLMAGVVGAVLLTGAFVYVHDPHGRGGIGEGLVIVPVFLILLPIGVGLGHWRAAVTLRKRYPRRIDGKSGC